MPAANYAHNRRGFQSKTYIAWSNMIQRCVNPKNKQFKDYGGRGILVCERWRRFANFLEDVGVPPHPSLTIERIDNALGYQPGNVKWATRKEQQRNTRLNRIVTALGVTACLTALCERFGINHSTARKRLRSGMNPDEIFSKSVDKRYSHTR